MNQKRKQETKENNVRVLLVDDSLIVLARLMTMLSDLHGVEVVGQAHNMSEGRAMFLKCKPDVVILDIQMPGGSGIDLLMKIKKNVPRTVVVMITNFPYMQYKQKCYEAGADHFLDKSGEFEKITEILSGLTPIVTGHASPKQQKSA